MNLNTIHYNHTLPRVRQAETRHAKGGYRILGLRASHHQAGGASKEKANG